MATMTELFTQVRRHLLESSKGDEFAKWTPAELLTYANLESVGLLNLIKDDALVQFQKKSTTVGSSGVAQIPSDAMHILGFQVAGVTPVMLKSNERSRFESDGYLGTTGNPVAIFSGNVSVDANDIYGRLDFKPANNATITWYYIPKLPDVTSSQDLEAPDWYLDLLVLATVARALIANGQINEAEPFLLKRNEQVKMINERPAGVMI